MNAVERISKMVNQPTAWEVALTTPTGKRYLIGYSQRKGKHAAYRLFAAHIKNIAPLIDDDDGDWNAAQQAFVAPNWKFGFFTGRTKREAILEGELPKLYA